MITPPPRPAPVALAVKLVVALTSVTLLETLAVVLDVGGVRSQVVSTSGADAQLTGTLTAAVVVATVVGAVIGTALWLVFGLLAGRGHGWARIVVTVLAGLAVLSSLASLADGSLLSLTAALRVALCAALVVLLFRPEANRWYADVKAARQQPVGAWYPPSS